MKLKRLFAVVLLAAMTLSTLISCGLVPPMIKGETELSNYPADAQAADVAISSNLGDIRVMSFNLQNSVKTKRRKTAIWQYRSRSRIISPLCLACRRTEDVKKTVCT